MKLVHPYIERQIIFDESKINVLTIENQKLFSEVVQEIISVLNGGNSKFVLSEGMDIINISKVGELCIDIFSCEINSKKAITKLYEILREKSVDEDMHLKTNQILSSIFSYTEDLIFEFGEYELSYNLDTDITNIFKAVDVKFDLSDKTYLEKLLDYVYINSEFLSKKLFIFVNLKSFLLEEELEEFYKMMFYKKINILLLESFEREYKFDCEEYYIIDKDLCQIK